MIEDMREGTQRPEEFNSKSEYKRRMSGEGKGYHQHCVSRTLTRYILNKVLDIMF